MKKRKIVGGAAGAAVALAAVAEASRRGRHGWGALQAPAMPHTLPEQLDRDWIDAPGGHRLHVVRAGSGLITCIFSHGVMLEARSWTHQLQSLPECGIAALAYDHRGHGSSTAPEEEYTIAAMADDLAAVVNAVSGPVVIVGHSMGGIVAQQFAIQHPELMEERVRGLGLVATLSRTPHFMHRGPGRRFGNIVFGTIPDEDRLFVHERFGRAAARLAFGQHPNPDDVEMVREMIADCELDNWRAALKSLIGFDLADSLRGLSVPTTVFAGTRDLVTPIWENRRIANSIPGARLIEYQGCGHMIMLERREVFEADLVKFIRSVQE